MGVFLAHARPAVSAFPERGIGSACTSSFSRIAQRSLTLRPAHSRGHLFVTRYPKASDISSPPCLLRLLPAGAMSPGGARTHWKAPPCHGAPPQPTLTDATLNGAVGWKRGIPDLPGLGCPRLKSGHSPPEATTPDNCAYFQHYRWKAGGQRDIVVHQDKRPASTGRPMPQMVIK
jgi:hypothetical protein